MKDHLLDPLLFRRQGGTLRDDNFFSSWYSWKVKKFQINTCVLEKAPIPLGVGPLRPPSPVRDRVKQWEKGGQNYLTLPWIGLQYRLVSHKCEKSKKQSARCHFPTWNWDKQIFMWQNKKSWYFMDEIIEKLCLILTRIIIFCISFR